MVAKEWAHQKRLRDEINLHNNEKEIQELYEPDDGVTHEKNKEISYKISTLKRMPYWKKMNMYGDLQVLHYEFLLVMKK